MKSITIVLVPHYLIRVGDALSQFFNVLLFNGMPNESISGRAARNALFDSDCNPMWVVAYHMINKLFFFQQNHCLEAYLGDYFRAVKLVDVVNGDDTINAYAENADVEPEEA